MNEALRLHSLKVLLDNQTPNGAYYACPMMPDYYFSWFRDGSFIAHALTIDGAHIGIQHSGSMAAQWESASRFHSWCAEIVNTREERVERSIARALAGEPPDVHDLLNARYSPDGSEGPDSWPEFQLDGLGTWLWSLREHVRVTHVMPLPTSWENAAHLVTRYLSALWSTPCYDCWEENGSLIHISTLAAIYGGLEAAQDLLLNVDTTSTRAAIRAFVLEKGLTPSGELAKSVGWDMVDANLLGAAVPYGLLDLHDPIIQRTIARIEREIYAPGFGIHRYIKDTYYGGGAWLLLVAWLGWYDVQTGNLDRARSILADIERHATPAGDFPEQVVPPMLASQSDYDNWVNMRGQIATPLLWSHAMYLLLSDCLRTAS